MKSIFFYLIVFLSYFSLAQGPTITWKVSDDSISVLKPYFNDEFQVDKLNKDKWLDIYQWGGLDFKTRMFSAPEMTYISNGILTLGADTTTKWYSFPDWILDSAEIRKNKVEIKDNKMQLNYLTSVIFSKEKFKYGYFECKAKAPSGQGLWPAFWLYGGEPNEEIDFMEMKGERHKEVHVDIHCPNRCGDIKMKGLPFKKSWGAWLKFNTKLVDEWVIYSGLWEPGRVTFYVNGDAVAEYLGDFKTSMHLITNLSFAIDNGPFKPGINKKTVLPNSFEVDYIRVWKNPTDSISLKSKPNVYFGTDEIRVFNPIKKTEIKNRKNHMFQRKSLKKEAGFVTVMPTKNKSIQLTKNGNRLGDVTLEILDPKGSVILSKTIKTDAETIDFSSLKRGNYVIQIKHNNQLSKVPFVY